MGNGADAHHAAEFQSQTVPPSVDVETPGIGVDFNDDIGTRFDLTLGRPGHIRRPWETAGGFAFRRRPFLLPPVHATEF
jgi:hypothetical protein